MECNDSFLSLLAVLCCVQPGPSLFSLGRSSSVFPIARTTVPPFSRTGVMAIDVLHPIGRQTEREEGREKSTHSGRVCVCVCVHIHAAEGHRVVVVGPYGTGIYPSHTREIQREGPPCIQAFIVHFNQPCVSGKSSLLLPLLASQSPPDLVIYTPTIISSSPTTAVKAPTSPCVLDLRCDGSVGLFARYLSVLVAVHVARRARDEGGKVMLIVDDLTGGLGEKCGQPRGGRTVTIVLCVSGWVTVWID